MNPRPTTTLLAQDFSRTLSDWVARFATPAWRGATVEGWLFEGLAARREAEQRLAAFGVQVRLRCAYKPLVFHFLEEIDGDDLAEVSIRYPVHPEAPPLRFLQEAYPLAALLPQVRLRFEPGTDDLHYHLEMTHRDGAHRTARVWAPNRLHTDLQGSTQLSPTGWLRVVHPADAAPHGDGPVQTDCEALFDAILNTVDRHPWPAREPYFERLEIRVDLPGVMQSLPQPLPVGHETISSHEALHEDIYFSLLEIFQRHSGRPAQDRGLQPGQIVPDVRASPEAVRLRITLQAWDAAAEDGTLQAAYAPDEDTRLDLLAAPPSPGRIAAALASLLGQRFAATSVQGRPVWGLYQPGASAAVLVSAGQHANETSGIVGALRAAEQLQAQEDAHFALIALENPDGYALHRALRLQHPAHMHHAARYSALGDDIEHRRHAPWHERAAREQALALSGAQLHINLHGYPAHEWTRPWSGYVPRGFAAWTIPKGFFLILRHHPGWRVEAEALLAQVSATLARVPGLADFNARQIALYETHAGPLPTAVVHGIAYAVAEVPPVGAPVTLITEFPDETLAGDAFRFAHTVQAQAVLAAVQAWQALARPST